MINWQIRTNGTNWDRLEQIGTKGTNWDKLGHMGQIGLVWKSNLLFTVFSHEDFSGYWTFNETIPAFVGEGNFII